MATHNYPCMLFSGTEHQVAAPLAAVEPRRPAPGGGLPSDGQRYSLATACTTFGGC